MYKMILLAAMLPLAGCASTTDKAAEAVPASGATVVTSAPQQDVAQPTLQTDMTPAPSQAAVEPTGWEQLNRRVLAWGDPVRRSVEQYCPPQNTTSNH
jgi:PBP1b-binding outer membrane lipoprotein LpoB